MRQEDIMTTSKRLAEYGLRLCASDDYQFINRSDIAVLDIIKSITSDDVSLENCLQNLVVKINDFYDEMLKKNLTKNIIVFARSQSYKSSNVIIRKKGIWGIADLSWLNKDYQRTDDLEQSDNIGTYYFGITKIKKNDLFNALNYSRLSRRMLVLFTDQIGIDNSLQSLSHSIINIRNSEINWSEAINTLCINNNIILKVDGAFDDRQVSVSLFMAKDLLNKLDSNAEVSTN
jgi:hypothetical protein